MHFCIKCDNMYYLKLNNDESLIYYCRTCGYEDDTLADSNISVSKTQLRRNEQKHNYVVNEYSKLDPTLPRINTIKCPNQNCNSNTKEVPREVLYIRYDDINMKYVYMCAVCDFVWNTYQHN